jgi:hypothetical protein
MAQAAAVTPPQLHGFTSQTMYNQFTSNVAFAKSIPQASHSLK